MRKHTVNPGQVFGRLTVISEVEPHVYPSGDTRRKFLAQCSCGSEPKSYLYNQLTTGATKSCGCLNIENLTSHGMHDTRAYQCWADMKVRCDNKANAYYDYYGGRGITYCDKWKTFEGFWEDMKDTYSEDLTLNRRDNDGMYCKENCEWDTKNFQGHMRRKKSGAKLPFIGSSYDEKLCVYRVRMKIDEKPVSFGTYSKCEDAAKAYDDASELYYGDRPNKTERKDDKIFESVKWYMENKDVDLRKTKRNPAARLMEEDVLTILKMYNDGVPQKEIAAKFNVSQTSISSIGLGRTWNKVTGLPKYEG